jgi:hypothetical protein
MRISKIILAVALISCIAASAQADTVLGRPVTASGSTTQSVPTCPTLEGSSCYNSATGQITFFIPLSTANGGVFGVTPHGTRTAGTYADTGSGASSTLTMWLMFSPVNLPVATASLTFSFFDLDLAGVNDPFGFFETVRFYDVNGNPISPTISQNNQVGGGTTYYPLNYTVTGNTTSQTIFFPDVTSIVQNPFFVQLTFGSNYGTRTGTNTSERLIATLNYTNPIVPPPPPPNQPVPEPGTMLMLASGMAGLTRLRRKA